MRHAQGIAPAFGNRGLGGVADPVIIDVGQAAQHYIRKAPAGERDFFAGQKLKRAVRAEMYKGISADFYPAEFGEWVDPESGVTAKNVIVGAALTNRPLFTSLAPIIASESDDEGGSLTVIQIANEQKEGNDMKYIAIFHMQSRGPQSNTKGRAYHKPNEQGQKNDLPM